MCLALPVRPRAGSRWWRTFAAVGAVFVATALAAGPHRLAAAPMIAIAVCAVVVAAARAWRPPAAPVRPRGVLRGIGRWSAAVVLALIVGLDAAFIEVFDPLSNDPVRELLEEAHALDLSKLSWTEAFERMHVRLSSAYAMGEWKRIDWAALHDRAAPKIAAAERARDRAAYYLALREYLWSVPDGHMDLSGDDGGLRQTAIRGGYGFALLRLDDGRTIANVVIQDGPAAKAGMRWGATILSWNGVAVDDAATRTPVLWSGNPPATNEGVRLARLKWLARAPVGTKAAIAFRNDGDDETRTATLESSNDEFAPVRAASQSQNFSLTSTNIDWRVLPESVGYLKIRAELPTLPQLFPERVVRDAAHAFVRAGVRGVIIDARANVGGSDKLVPLMMGFFVAERQFYEHAAFYDDRTRRFEREPAGTFWTEPRSPAFHGPIAVLVDQQCASSGEGLALVARRRAGGHVVGFYGTYGSFGMSGAEIEMPGGLTVSYPDGRSLDVNGEIQLDSDWRLEGGVVPDVRVPVTLENARAQFKDGRDVVLETAVALMK
jgi:carboxyl-terminal processing protease